MSRTQRRILLVLSALVALCAGAVVLTARLDDGTAEVSGAAPMTSTTASPARTLPPATTTTVRGELGSGVPITIAFAGDMHFEGGLRGRLRRDPSTVVGPFAATLGAADLAVGNLETAIATGGTRVDKRYTFRAPPAAVDALRAAGFDVVSMANNHGLDYGPDGLAETLAVTRAQPDRFVIGVGGDDAEAFAPFTSTVKGQRVAVIAATQVLDDDLIASWTATASQAGLASAKRVDRLADAVRVARATSDTVVVFLHWGTEQQSCPNAQQQTLASTLVAAGADIVVGSHAHRLQGAGRLGGALVGYGLGNFLFGAPSAASAQTGVLEVTVTGRRVDGYRWVPGRISGSVPQPLTGTAAEVASAEWEQLRACTDLTR